MSSSSSHLLDLPVELVIRILDFLDHKSLLRASQTCYLFHTIIKETVSVQYRLALAATNTAEPSTHLSAPTSPWSLHEKLEEIKRRELAWMGLKFDVIEKTPMRTPSGVYELQHGLFLQGTPSSSGQNGGLRIVHLGRASAAVRSRAPGSVNPVPPPTSSEASTSYSSTHRLPRASTIEYELGFDFADFNADPEQDLAVYVCTDGSKRLNGGIYRLGLVETSLRIRKLSDNGGPHPLARSERLELGVPFQRGLSFYIQIFGDFVGVLTRSISGLQPVRDTSEFIIYNWKTGVLQARCRRKHIANFIFLSSTSFMLISNHDPPGLLVYRFKPLRTASNAIPGWSDEGPGPLTPQCLASYLLPPLHPRAESMSEVSCRCEPTPVFEPPDYDDDDNDDEAEESTVPGGNVAGGSTNGAHGNHSAGTSKGSGTRLQESQAPPKPYPMPTPSLIVRPGVDDFRVAVISYAVRREASDEDLIGFIAISELFKDAQERERGRLAHRSSLRETTKETTSIDTEAHVPTDPSAAPTPRWVIPWEEWGPKWSRFLEGTISLSWVCYIYMNRFVLAMPDPPMDTRIDEEEWTSDSDGDGDGDHSRSRWRQECTYLCVLDFNPNAIDPSYPARLGGAWNPLLRMTTADGAEEEGEVSLTDDTEDWETEFSFSRPSKAKGVHERTHTIALPIGEDLFSEPLITTLPYRKLYSYTPVKGRWLPMIDAERILLVADDNDDDGAMGPRTIKTLAF